MVRMLYTPRPLFGLEVFRLKPTIVDVVGVDNVLKMALIRHPIEPSSILGILSRTPRSIERWVRLADLARLEET